MSDEFLKVARQEIRQELDKLERIVMQCNNDEHVFSKAQSINVHLHKIKGLAPMIGQEKIGEMARTSDVILRYIISNGPLPGSCSIITKTVKDMDKIWSGFDIYDLLDFKKQVHDKFPQIPEL